MRSRTTILFVAVLVWTALPALVYAQRGMGDPIGVARQGVRPEIVSLSGAIVGVETGPCDKTTGGGLIGTHVLLKTEKGNTLNVHLGWAEAPVVKKLAKELTVGKKATIAAFRTDKMPKDHFVAKSVAYDKTTVELRDEFLRPVWAGAARGWQQGQGRGWGRGRGWRW